jgi:hypothetical protein
MLFKTITIFIWILSILDRNFAYTDKDYQYLKESRRLLLQIDALRTLEAELSAEFRSSHSRLVRRVTEHIHLLGDQIESNVYSQEAARPALPPPTQRDLGGEILYVVNTHPNTTQNLNSICLHDRVVLCGLDDRFSCNNIKPTHDGYERASYKLAHCFREICSK